MTSTQLDQSQMNPTTQPPMMNMPSSNVQPQYPMQGQGTMNYNPMLQAQPMANMGMHQPMAIMGMQQPRSNMGMQQPRPNQGMQQPRPNLGMQQPRPNLSNMHSMFPGQQQTNPMMQPQGNYPSSYGYPQYPNNN